MTKPEDMTFDEATINNVVGRRPENVQPIDEPCELGYHCPVCQYPLLQHGNFDERLVWSEFNGFLWCTVCKKDYPSALCCGDNIDRAIEVYLLALKDHLNEFFKPVRAEGLTVEALNKEMIKRT